MRRGIKIEAPNRSKLGALSLGHLEPLKHPNCCSSIIDYEQTKTLLQKKITARILLFPLVTSYIRPSKIQSNYYYEISKPNIK